MIDDNVIAVIADYIRKYYGETVAPDAIRAWLDTVDTVPFKGGVWIIDRNEFDCFTVPEVRGKWANRRMIEDVIGNIVRKYGSAKALARHDNQSSRKSLEKLGFQLVGEAGGICRYELQGATSWAA